MFKRNMCLNRPSFREFHLKRESQHFCKISPKSFHSCQKTPPTSRNISPFCLKIFIYDAEGLLLWCQGFSSPFTRGPSLFIWHLVLFIFNLLLLVFFSPRRRRPEKEKKREGDKSDMRGRDERMRRREEA